MLESQKLSFQQFMLGYKHGVYVLTTDSCEICHKYKQSIEYINNGNLYFVDVITAEDRDYAFRLTQRGSFPLTVVFWDNQIEYVRLGQLFELQLEEIFASLKKFGDKPLTKDEQERRMQAIRNRCELSYYVFPPELDPTIREQLIYTAIKHNELPIDVEALCPNLEPNERYRLFEGHMPFSKLVIFRDKNTNTYSGFSQRIITGYSSKVKDAKFVIRQIEDELNASNNSN